MSDIPATCNNCLGKNPHVEMIREKDGRECKVCTRAFTSFLWYSNKDSSTFKRTNICLTCARARNACQCCLLDLKLKVDTDLRDEILGAHKGLKELSHVHISANNSKIAKIYKANELERDFQDKDSEKLSTFIPSEVKVSQIHETAKNTAVMLSSSTVSKKSLSSTKGKDKKQKPPVGKEFSKILNKLPFNGNLSIPKDPETRSMFLFGITDELTNFSVQEFFKEEFNIPLKATILNHRARCGFVLFESRKSAEAVAAAILADNPPEGPSLILIDRVPIRVAWGKVCNLGLNNKEQLKLAQVVKRQLSILSNNTRILNPSTPVSSGKTVNMAVSNNPFTSIDFSSTEL